MQDDTCAGHTTCNAAFPGVSNLCFNSLGYLRKDLLLMIMIG